MVAKINTPKRVLSALNYNEKKAARGKATCIYASNYLQQASQMNFYQKLSRLDNQNKLNERATTKTLHISLNFDPKEKLSEDKLIKIATEYMNRINCKAQPYLVISIPMQRIRIFILSPPQSRQTVPELIPTILAETNLKKPGRK